LQDAESLGREVLAVDPAFQWVVVLNEEGETLAHVYSEKFTARMRLGRQTKERLGAVDTVFLEAASQAEKWYGRMDFILLAYRKAKVMLMYSKRHGVYLAARIPRSAVAEHLDLKLKRAFNRSKKFGP
jgi:hypothetical protein